MLPVCGYHMGDYFAHWLSMAQRADRAKLPKIFFVNWFRKSPAGKWLWPGYGDNSRVLKWVCERVEGRGKFTATPIGNLPTPDALDLSGAAVTLEEMKQLLAVDVEAWKREADDTAVFFEKFGSHLPPALKQELADLKRRLAGA